MSTRAGFVSIIGKPNVGKSTLLNALLGEKLSITTNKPQTTRKRVLGILSGDDYQVIFLDTPGILDPKYLLQKKMMGYVLQSVGDSDLLLCLVDIDEDPDASKTLNDELVKEILARKNLSKILIINKIDLSNETKVNSLISSEIIKSVFDTVIPVSAKEKYNIDRVLGIITENLPVHPKYYPDDQISDEPERFFVSEIIREKIFEIYQEEIPYSTEVLIEEFHERKGRKDFIQAAVFVERESQKGIIVGKKGETIKKLGLQSRNAIETFLQREVYLDLRVKVRPKWRSSEKFLKNFGYDKSDD
jgi:GTP-binding protein Era